MNDNNQHKEIEHFSTKDYLSDSKLRREKRSLHHKEMQMQTIRGLAGDKFDRMMEAPETTIRYLKDPNPEIRMAAISILSDIFNLNNQMESEWERIAYEDGDSEVRQEARMCLIVGRYDWRAMHLLAEMVLDSSIPDYRRLEYYRMMKSKEDIIMLKSKVDKIIKIKEGKLILKNEEYRHLTDHATEVPESIDWDFVKKYFEMGSASPANRDNQTDERKTGK
jgi:hypothetical protein